MRIQYKEVDIEVSESYLSTKGLTNFIGKEIRINLGSHQQEDYVEVMRYMIDYIIGSHPTILENQTIGYYSWLLKFKINEQNQFDLYEVNADGSDFNRGCDLAITVIRSQSALCSKYGLIPMFPDFNQMVVISDGVYEGKDLEAIRYESPEHMSGWWLITDEYDNNIESLMTVHFHYVAFNRPDILKYLALPFDYRFLIDNGRVEISQDEEEDPWLINKRI